MRSDPARQPLLLINVVGLTPALLGAATPCINALLKTAKMATLQPVFPAVTSTVQASILTGQPPSEHGIIGNGWYFRDQAEVRFWLQPNALIQGGKGLADTQASVPRVSLQPVVLVVQHVCRRGRRHYPTAPLPGRWSQDVRPVFGAGLVA